MNACGDTPHCFYDSHHDSSNTVTTDDNATTTTTTTAILNTSSTSTNAEGSDNTSTSTPPLSVTTLQQQQLHQQYQYSSAIQDGDNCSSVSSVSDSNNCCFNNNNNNNNDNINGHHHHAHNHRHHLHHKKSIESRTACSLHRSDNDIPDHVFFIKFKQGEERIYSAYFRREQRHLLSVLVAMTITHAVTSVVLDTVTEITWSAEIFRRVAVVVCLSAVVLVLYGVQRLAGLYWRLKELAAILVWFLLSCQIFYASTTTMPRHLASDDLSWIALLTFATQVMLPVGAWRAAVASVLLVGCHTTLTAVRNSGESHLILQVFANCLVVLPSVFLGLAVSVLLDRLLRKSVLETKAVLIAKAKIEAAYQEKKSLLLSVLPSHVAEEMIQDVGGLSDGQFRKIYMSRYENVSILFADIVGFTAISSSVTAAELVHVLNQLFGRFDVLAGRYHQDRIKILGDCYYCVCGALSPRPDHAVLCIHMGLAMVDTMSFVRRKTAKDVNMRVGVHTGACLGGVLGQRQWQFDVLGKEVTLANKMESGGIPGRVHISEMTKSCLNEEFVLEDGYGGEREEDLRLRNVRTFLVKAVLKPYPQGTLDDKKEAPKTSEILSNANPNSPTTSSTSITPPASKPTLPTTTNPPKESPKTTSTTTSAPAPTTTTKPHGSTAAVVAADAPVNSISGSTTTDNSKPIRIQPSSLQTTTTDISATTTSATHNIKRQEKYNQNYNQNKQQQKHHLFQDERSTKQKGEGPNQQQRSQSVKASSSSRKNRVRKLCLDGPNSEGIRRRATTRTTIAATQSRGLKGGRFYRDDVTSKDNAEAEGDEWYDSEDSCHVEELVVTRGGRCHGDTTVEMDLQRALEEKEANRTLGGRINRLTMTFTDVSMETRYKQRSQSYSGLPLVALCLAFTFASGARFLVLPRSALAVTSFLFGQLVLTVMAAVSIATTCTKRFPAAVVRFAVTVEYNSLARMLWGASACAVFLLCDVIPIAECETKPHNISGMLTGADNPVEIGTQDSICRHVVYYAYTTTVTLFAMTSLVNVGHVTKVAGMWVVGGLQCLLYLVVMEGALDNYQLAVYNGNRDHTSTKHRLVAQTIAITFILSVFGRKMERLYRKLFLWKEESKREKVRAMDLQRKNEALVFNLMPAHVAKDFIGTRVNKRGLYSKAYNETGVIFAACPNFHAFYNESAVNNNGLECLRFLNEIISDYDELLNQSRFSSIVKIKTVGPTYMAVSGMTAQPEGSGGRQKPTEVTDRWRHLNDLVQFALGLQDVLRKINEQSFNNFILRIGINHGPLIAGVIGMTKPHYDVWGNTVNVASRMESTGQASRIQVVEETKTILERFGYRFESRGLINVKGKGQLVTYFLERSSEWDHDVMPNQVPGS